MVKIVFRPMLLSREFSDCVVANTIRCRPNTIRFASTFVTGFNCYVKEEAGTGECSTSLIINKQIQNEIIAACHGRHTKHNIK